MPPVPVTPALTACCCLPQNPQHNWGTCAVPAASPRQGCGVHTSTRLFSCSWFRAVLGRRWDEQHRDIKAGGRASREQVQPLRAGGLPGSMACTPGRQRAPQHQGVFPRTTASLLGEHCFGRTWLQGSAMLCCWKASKQETCPGHRHTGNRQLAGQSLGEGTEPVVLTPRLSSRGDLPAGQVTQLSQAVLLRPAALELQGRKVQNKCGVCDRHRENEIKQGNPSSSKHYSR